MIIKWWLLIVACLYSTHLFSRKCAARTTIQFNGSDETEETPFWYYQGYNWPYWYDFPFNWQYSYW